MDGFKKLESYIIEETGNNIEELKKLINNNDIIGFNKLSECVRNTAFCKCIIELERRDNDELLKELQDIDKYIAKKTYQECSKYPICDKNCKWNVNDICVPCEYFRVTNQTLDMLGLKSQLPINLL